MERRQPPRRGRRPHEDHRGDGQRRPGRIRVEDRVHDPEKPDDGKTDGAGEHPDPGKLRVRRDEVAPRLEDDRQHARLGDAVKPGEHEGDEGEGEEKQRVDPDDHRDGDDGAECSAEHHPAPVCGRKPLEDATEERPENRKRGQRHHEIERHVLACLGRWNGEEQRPGERDGDEGVSGNGPGVGLGEAAEADAAGPEHEREPCRGAPPARLERLPEPRRPIGGSRVRSCGFHVG